MTTLSPEGPADAATSTLGSLLYGSSAAPPVLETEWVAVVHSIVERKQAALQELFNRTHGIVFTLIFRIVKDPLTAEELTLDVFHDVWRNAARFDPARGSVVAWLMNQARSRAIDAVRSQNRQKRTASPTAEAASADEAPHSSDVEAQRQVLERCLQTLTVEERRAIETAYFGERTYSEAAQHLGEPLGTVKTRIRAGLSKLRTILAGQEVL